MVAHPTSRANEPVPQSDLPLHQPPEGPIGRIMPWVLSGLLHLGIVAIMALLALMTMPPETPPTPHFSGAGLETTTPPTIKPPGADSGRMRRGFESPKIEKIAVISDQPSRASIKGIVTDGGTGLGDRGAGRDKSIFGIPNPEKQDAPATHIIYVVDRSGSMLAKFGILQDELMASIASLQFPQHFDVIFFSDGAAIESPSGLVPAFDEHKLRVASFLTAVRASGSTDPLPALTRAFEVLNRLGDQNGKTICLLTDGAFAQSQQVMDAIKKLNSRQDVRINTILFGQPSGAAENVLKRIAKDHRGWYKYINLD